ncbi:unnamed protein product [Gadus morhua 'NCC']
MVTMVGCHSRSACQSQWQPARPASGSQRGRQVAASAAGKWQPARPVAASAASGSQRGQWQPARTVAASAAGLSSQLASRYQPGVAARHYVV